MLNPSNTHADLRAARCDTLAKKRETSTRRDIVIKMAQIGSIVCLKCGFATTIKDDAYYDARLNEFEQHKIYDCP